MRFVGLEEIFLKVQDLDRAIDFYHNKLGIPLDKHDQERAYLQCDPGAPRTTNRTLHRTASRRRADALCLYGHGGHVR